MSYFDEVYIKRANRFGIDYQSRVQGQREYLFDLYLQKSLYRIDFEWNNSTYAGSFEKHKQNNTETLHYLLTKIDVNIPNGTILMLPRPQTSQEQIENVNPILGPWMVYYKEHIQSSGYNRYVMLRMSHYLTWTNREGVQCNSWAYMYGQEDNMLKDELRSRSRMDTLYSEALKMSFFVIPFTKDIRKDDYLEIQRGELTEAYVVTGYDIQSAEGIEYVTVDPVYLRDHSPTPQPTEQEIAEGNLDDYFWFTGGHD